MLLPEKNEINKLVDSCVQKYQAGDKSALDDVYEHLSTFCLRVISKTSGRYIKSDDDEAGIIPNVILDVLDKYDRERGPFLVYLGRAMRNRTIDGARRAKRNPSMQLADLSSEQATFISKADTEFFENIIDDIARRQEIETFAKLLNEFEMNFNDLVQASPRQQKTRIQAQQAAWIVARDQELSSYLFQKRMLPNKVLEGQYGINRQILDRYRRYIIATVLIIINDFVFLKAYVLPVEREEVQWLK